MIYDVFLQKLQAHGFVSGSDVFLEFVPAEITRAVMLRTPFSGVKIDPFIPGRYKGELQVVCRETEVGHGRALSKLVQKILTTQSREIYPATAERGEVHLDLAFPQTLPVRYPTLEGNAIEWSQVFDVVWGAKDIP